ncbi:MAG TPA: cardiolipin synthase [Paucimonas sp.]|nr:cardiolipin synthase [Paucimonas sp.]
MPAGFRYAAAVAAAVFACGCAALPDYEQLRRIDAPLRRPLVKGQQGLLSQARADAILRDLQRQGKSGLLERHLAFMHAISEEPLVEGNAVRLLIDGPHTYDAMFDAIAAARHHVHLETYILEEDEIGKRFSDLLIRKAGEGVQVGLIYDSVGALGTSGEFFEKLRAHGIKVCEFNPVNPVKGRLLALNNRDHRKLLVVDGKTGFAGGINISRVYSSAIFGKRREAKRFESWRDTHIEVRGPAVRDFQRLFLDTWKRQNCAPLANRHYYPPLARAGNTVVQTIGSGPETALNLIYLNLLSAISQAEHSVYITMAYFVPDRQTLEALKRAARRGVDVRLLLPGFSDYAITFHAGRSYYGELLRAGVRIHERRDALLHAKTVVIDGVWSTVGSSNIDLRSFLHNNELNVVVLGSDFAQQMQRMFRADLESSVAIDLPSWERRGPLARIKERLARLWEYWL